MKYNLRTATQEDTAVIEELIKSSSRTLGIVDYTKEQIELALTSALGLDTQLIKDHSYFIVEGDGIKGIVGCGGWSYRETLFGNDSEQNRNPKTIDPSKGAAKIRAFFVSPEFSRRGIGTLIMQHCEQQAIKHGYKKIELMATLPGVKLYQKHGYQTQNTIDYPLSNDLTIEFVAMSKQL